MLTSFKVSLLANKCVFYLQTRTDIRQMGDPWNGILKFLECKDETNQQIEFKEWIKKMELKCLKNKSCLLPESWLLKCKTWLFFVFSTDGIKKLVTTWAKHLSATERSSWVNMTTRQMTSFLFIYYLNSICWKIPFLHLRPNSVPFAPPFDLVLICKIHSFTCQRWQF